MKALYAFAFTLCLLPGLAGANTETLSAEEEAYYAWAGEIWDALDRQTGRIEIPGTGAVLDVPDSFYYLNPADAERVLVEVWENPPGQMTLGMLFPADKTPFDNDSWAVIIRYEEDGYVSDEDADDIDYAELLTQMKQDTEPKRYSLAQCSFLLSPS